MALQQNYYPLWFKSFRLPNTSGHRNAIQLSLKQKQTLPLEIVAECKARNQKPTDLLTECKRDYFTKFPEGTKFLLKAKLTDREGRTLFFYSSYRWKALKIVKS